MRMAVHAVGFALACAVLAGGACLPRRPDARGPLAPVPAPDPGAAGIELLRDPGFVQGVTQGYANHLPAAEREDCLARWNSRGLGDAQWAFWEISERLHFAHNPDAPLRAGPGAYEWSTVDLAKQCSIDHGAVRFRFDTGREWREGGSLWLSDADGKRPRYGNPATTWPHFLVGQHLVASNDAMYPIPDHEKLLLDTYKRLRFTLEVKLNRLERSSQWDHREEFGAADHALFYIGFAVMPRETQCIAQRGKFYILIPAIYSEGGAAHVQQCAPWLGIDQFGDGVFFSGSPVYPHLVAGSWVPYDVDVAALVREGLTAAAARVAPEDRKRSLDPKDYFVAVLLIGWEVWGGFATDVEFRGVSLRGYGESVAHAVDRTPPAGLERVGSAAAKPGGGR